MKKSKRLAGRRIRKERKMRRRMYLNNFNFASKEYWGRVNKNIEEFSRACRIYFSRVTYGKCLKNMSDLFRTMDIETMVVDEVE